MPRNREVSAEGLPKAEHVLGAASSASAKPALRVERSSGLPNNSRQAVLWLQATAFFLGFVLLAYVINRVGVQPIFDALSSIGFGFLTLLLISGSRHVFRALAMITAVPPEYRRFNFWQALSARLGGEAISFLTFTGPLLGEATKAALLRRRVPLAHGVPALVIDNLLYHLSVALFVLSGIGVMLLSYQLPSTVRFALMAIAVGALLGLAVVRLATSRRMMPLTWLLDNLARRGFKSNFLLARREQVHGLESNVYDFYRYRRGSFLLILGLDFCAHAASAVEVYVALRMLAVEPSVAAVYVIEALTKVINFAFGFVPATIGVYEGGTELILQTLGYLAATGVTLALVRKAGIVFWTSIGLTILTWRTVPNAARHLANKYPRLQKAMDNLVLSNLSHRPARTVVSVLGVGLGVFLIIFTVGLAHGVLRERGRRDGNVGAEIVVRASGTLGLSGSEPFALPLSRAAEIKQLDGVRAAVPVGHNTINSDRGFGLRALDGIPFDEYAALTQMRITEGRSLISGDEAIIDEVWRDERRASISSTVQLYDRPFRIVGVYEPPGGGRIKIPLATMQEQLGSGSDRVSSILVACTNPDQQEEVAARIHDRFPDDQIILTRDLPELYSSSVPALNVFISVVVTIASIISTLVILLAMYTTVTERTKQIGILKSLGMPNTTIAWVIEQEAIIVSVLGVLVGVLFTLAARFAIMRLTSLTVDIEPRWIGISLLIGLVGGTVGALYPALRAARQDAVEALSYE